MTSEAEEQTPLETRDELRFAAPALPSGCGRACRDLKFCQLHSPRPSTTAIVLGRQGVALADLRFRAVVVRNLGYGPRLNHAAMTSFLIVTAPAPKKAKSSEPPGGHLRRAVLQR